jgi:2-haloacid dehalogenase
MSPIRALAFDAYGTLFDVLSITQLCEELFPGNGMALAQLWRTKQLQYSWLRSLMERHQDFWHLTGDGLAYATKALKLDLTPQARSRLMDAYLTLAPFPDVVPGMGALKLAGLKLAILSNGAPQMLDAVVTSAGIAKLLDAVISVEDVEVFKPSPRVYQLAAEALRMDARDIGFVSANSWDIHGAGSAGLKTFWIQRTAAEPEEELGYPATKIIRTLTDVPAFIV